MLSSRPHISRPVRLGSTLRFLLFVYLVLGALPLDANNNPDEQPITTAQAEQVELPVDGHLSAGALPPELSNSISCTCDRASSSTKSKICIDIHDTGSCGARIFYLIGIHNNRTLNDAVYLFRGIRDSRNTILFHIDVKFDFAIFQNSTLQQEIEACPCGSNVEVASVHNASWGSWSMNLPTLWGIEKAVKEYSGKWDVFINLSGDTLPVYTPDRIAQLFGGPLKGINFITSSACETGLIPTPISAFPKKWHKRGHYSQHAESIEYVDDDGKLHQNVTLETYFGSQWMTLLPESSQYLVEQLERPDSLVCRFRDYLVKTKKLMTDETFIPTLLMHLFPETTPTIREDFSLDTDEVEMYAIRYERMDEHVPTSNGYFPSDQRYEVAETLGVESPRPWGPYFLGVYDLENIQISGALYIRKVATAIDHNLFKILPVDDRRDIPPISWPNEVQVSPKPNWAKKIADLRRKHDELQAKKKQQELENENEIEEKPETDK